MAGGEEGEGVPHPRAARHPPLASLQQAGATGAGGGGKEKGKMDG